MDIEWEDLWCGLAFVLAVLVLVIGTVAAFTDHTSRKYYLSGGNGQLTCVMADQPWETDPTLRCFPSFEEAIEAVKKANETLKTK